MIRLKKGPKPDILVQNEERWTHEYMAGLEDGDLSDTKRYRYRHTDIKNALRAETHAKCAYCESNVSHVHPGETDHIYPKRKRPDLVVAWDNLTYVCTECNRRKLDYYSKREPLVNPYVDDPSEHLMFAGPLVLHRDNKGLRTNKKVELSRAELVERRQERIEQVNMLVQKWNETADGPTKEFLRQEIVNWATSASEFSATMNAYLGNIPGFVQVAAGDV